MKKKTNKTKPNPNQLSLFTEYRPEEDYTDYSEDERYEVFEPKKTVTILDSRYLEKVRGLACDWTPEIGARVFVPIEGKTGTITGIVPTHHYDVANKKVFNHPPEEPGLIGYRVLYDDGTTDSVYGRQMFPISSEEISQKEIEQMAKATSLFI